MYTFQSTLDRTPNIVHFPVYTHDGLHPTQYAVSSQHSKTTYLSNNVRSTRQTPQILYTFQSTLKATYTANSKHWFTTSFLLLEEGAGKRRSECAYTAHTVQFSVYTQGDLSLKATTYYKINTPRHPTEYAYNSPYSTQYW